MTVTLPMLLHALECPSQPQWLLKQRQANIRIHQANL